MPHNTTITRCNDDDLAPAMTLLAVCARQALFDDVDPELQARFLAANTAEHALNLIAKGYHYLCAKHDDALIGFVSVSPLGHIHQLFVEPHAQRQGLGSALLQTAMNQAHIRDAVTRITVAAALGAVPFYEKNGFTSAPKQQYWNGVAYREMAKPLPQPTA
ncbi:GNAT family N-acetyltransferase [Chitinibacteraceae bacterium HSL-7]